uniref:Transducin family protein n=1 Tax=Rhizophora mucronata TaxID=61149 RepID=A0A2P2K7V7_RHIMU
MLTCDLPQNLLHLLHPSNPKCLNFQCGSNTTAFGSSLQKNQLYQLKFPH